MRENEWSWQGAQSSPLAESMYNEHFGFTESPFNVTPDSRFFFVNPCYEEAFATLRYGIDARKGFVVITGQPGTGKTTLLKRLTCSLSPTFRPRVTSTRISPLFNCCASRSEKW